MKNIGANNITITNGIIIDKVKSPSLSFFHWVVPIRPVCVFKYIRLNSISAPSILALSILAPSILALSILAQSILAFGLLAVSILALGLSALSILALNVNWHSSLITA